MVEETNKKEFIKMYARLIVKEAKKKGLITTYADFCKTKESKEYALTE